MCIRDRCKDCFIPSFNYRPGGSAQYALAIGNFDEEKVKRFNFGFIASSDNHRARPGTGYKEINRFVTTEANGATSAYISEILFPMEEPLAEPLFIATEDLQNQRTGFELKFQHNFWKYLISYYIPSGILVIFSWVSAKL